MENMNDGKEALINLLKAEPVNVLSLAYLYARNLHEYGVDVTKEWDIAVQQADNLRRAYQEGYTDALKDFDTTAFKCALEDLKAEMEDFSEEVFHRPNTDYSDYAAVVHCMDMVQARIDGIK